MSIPTNPEKAARVQPPAESVIASDPERTNPSHEEDKGGDDPEHMLQQLEEDILSHPAMQNVQVSYDRLDNFKLKLCVLFLSIFPKKEVLKKRLLIYWWIGEGLVKTEAEGEIIFEDLLKLDLVMPYGNAKSQFVSKCQIHPWNRYMLISLAKRAQLFDFDSKGTPLFQTTSSRRACLILDRENRPLNDASSYEKLRTIFNVNEQYLDFEYEWISKLKSLVVLQLGRWQKSSTHHIEVQREAFLKGLRTQKYLKYLSLRGISRITELPPSIVKLVSLEILDLKACHNLEKLPAAIASLRKLTHLDVSECYLLESMPKGLEKLTSLQALKGFIIGNSKKTTPCSISDLANLKNLKRLSIYIGSEATITDGEFDNLKTISSLQSLKISCSVISDKVEKQVAKQSFSFPPSLEKLDLEGIPHVVAPRWLVPSRLKNLRQLSIKGGKLQRLDHEEEDKWKVEILRLHYLKDLKIEQPKLKELFPSAVNILIKYAKQTNPKKT